MKKKTKIWISAGIPLLLIVTAAWIVGNSYAEHRELIEQEKKEFPAPGALVDINDDGKELHVFAKGEGDTTLVFMSGLGTSSPVYDFKALYHILSDDYRIAVVERAGYGWSDISSSPRDIDTVLEETRSALELSGENPPYVLFPHSLAGLEAIHWANHFPVEVAAVIGLDPLVPEYQKQAEEAPSFSSVIDLLMRTGLVRHQPEVFNDNFPAMKKGHLTEEEAEIARTIFYRRVQTENMKEEVNSLQDNAHLVAEQGKPDLPFHVFIAAENEDEYWSSSLTSYAQETGGEYFILNAGHYIHLDNPELIAEKSRELIEKTQDN